MNDIENDLLIRELEESVKQDRLNKLWADYGSYIIGGAVIIVLATAFFSFTVAIPRNRMPIIPD